MLRFRNFKQKMEDDLKILKLTFKGQLLATPPKRYNQNNPEYGEFYKTNDPVPFINDWQNF